MEEKAPKTSFIGQAWLVILLALLYGGGLAGVQLALGPRIAENKRNETYALIPEMVPGAATEKTVELEIVGADGKNVRVYKAVSADDQHLGWVIPASGGGFADRIECIIGVDATLSVITGVYVLDQKETPGLGDLITTADFLDRLKGKATDLPLTVVKRNPQAANDVLSLTGATISSVAVCDIVNNAIANTQAPLRQLASADAATPKQD